MNGSGRLLAGAWNDFDFNDGCGFAYSITGGSTWAPRTFVPGFTKFTNNPAVPGTGSFEVAGDPAVAWNPKFHTFDVVCQAFNLTPPFPISSWRPRSTRPKPTRTPGRTKAMGRPRGRIRSRTPPVPPPARKRAAAASSPTTSRSWWTPALQRGIISGGST
jgi:hypothetical protein